MKLKFLLRFISASLILFYSESIFAQPPDFQWAHGMGSADYDESYAIAADASGNIYISGQYNDSVDFDPGPGTFYLNNGIDGIYVSKYDSQGHLIWAKTLVSSSGSGEAMTVDGDANVYITGFFQGHCDFDPGPDSAFLTSGM